ncbi:MAG: glycosyltransferase family 4 protein [Syntrophobacteraceae bacterium]
MKFLFCLYDAPWPIRGGQQLHTYNMIQGLVSLGHDVHLAAYGDIGSFPAQKHIGWSVSRLCEDGALASEVETKSLDRWTAERWMRYWGTPLWVPSAIDKLIQELQPETVIVVGLQALPLAALIRNVPAVWYVADDWVLHHLTLAGKGPLRDRIESLKGAALSLCYERSLSSQVEGAIAVSKKDQKALRCVGGFQRVSLIRNGVDAEFFHPEQGKESQNPSICFWGRMDFAPNVDAMLWFCCQIWPLLLNSFPDAVLTIAGANPTSAVNELGKIRNVIVTGEVDDVRPFALHSQVVVLPMRTGGGIKNKLLEACAMGKPIVASRTAVAGLQAGNESSEPWIIARNREDWINAIKLLWTNTETRANFGNSARNFVVEHHSWRQAAVRFVGFTSELRELNAK